MILGTFLTNHSYHLFHIRHISCLSEISMSCWYLQDVEYLQDDSTLCVSCYPWLCWRLLWIQFCLSNNRLFVTLFLRVKGFFHAKNYIYGQNGQTGYLGPKISTFEQVVNLLVRYFWNCTWWQTLEMGKSDTTRFYGEIPIMPKLG